MRASKGKYLPKNATTFKPKAANNVDICLNHRPADTKHPGNLWCLCQAPLCSTNRIHYGARSPRRGLFLRCMCVETKPGKFCCWSLSNSSTLPSCFAFSSSKGTAFSELDIICFTFKAPSWMQICFPLNSSTTNLTLYLQSSWLISWYCTWID